MENTAKEEIQTVELSNKATVIIRLRGGYTTTTKGVATPDKTVEIANCPIDKVDEVMPIFSQALQDLDVAIKNDIKNNGYTCCTDVQ